MVSKGNTVNSSGSAQRDKGSVPPRQQQHGPQSQPTYGGSVPRQSLASPPSQPLNRNGQLSIATFKKSPNDTSNNNSNSQQQSNGSIKHSPSSTSPISPKQEPFVTSPRRLLTEIPSSSLALSFDRDPDMDQPQDQEKLRQQALQYQQKLRQRPPKQGGEDTDDDDSDSGSIASYRRSIHRLSMTYNGRPGVPNISLFAPHQRPQIVQHGRSTSGSKNVLVESPKAMTANKEFSYPQHDQQQRSQQQQHRRQHSGNQPSYPQNPGNPRSENPESASSLASIDHHHHQRANNHNNQRANRDRNDDSARPRIVRSNTEGHSLSQRPRDIQIPERSISADNIPPKTKTSKQNTLESLQEQHFPKVEHHPYPPNHLPLQTSPKSSSSSLPNAARGVHYESRPSEESSQTMRSQHDRNRSEASRRSGDTPRHGATSPNRSKSPGGAHSQNPARTGGGGGQSLHPLPTVTRGVGAAGGYGHGHLNMHPAHHLLTGGYVRPEEAVGPSNPMPEKAEDYVRQGIEFHELGDISKATNYFRTAAELGDPVGMLMYGLSVRHGWGCKANRVLAFQYLQKSAEHAVGDLNSRDSFASTAAKGELVLAIYELGICFRHGWGVEKNKKTAAYYFEIAANLGDPDAQNDLAWCYYHGIGVKKDMYKSAKYYRLASAQGQGTIGNQWIWKDKYGGPTSPTPIEKGHSHYHALRAF
ncbi:hypothetical protein BGZ46_001755 [Entomortierella lignicola]|nr:hypothetical protein BGZ46_001755 [Entomortierella lignicola]